MAQLNPYLVFNGNCEEAFEFYKSVFGGEFSMFERFKNMPPNIGPEIPDSGKELLMHISLPVGKQSILLGSDANPLYDKVNIGQNISVSVSADTKEEADNIFHKLADGGKVTMPIVDTFWNAYFGMLIDRFQNYWMISYDYPQGG